MSAVCLSGQLSRLLRALACAGAICTGVTLFGCEQETASAPLPEAEPARSVRRTAERAEWIDTRPRAASASASAHAANEKSPDDLMVATRAAAVPSRESAWARAARGDWAEYAMQDGFHQRLTVVAVGADSVRVRLEMFLRDEPLGLPAERQMAQSDDAALDDPRIRGGEIAASRETIAAAGRHWDARRVEARWTEEEVAYERVTWTAVEGPLSGLLRQETRADGRLTHRRELAAFGAGARLAD